ncbi:hypothetical protein L7F22_024941 [Adiantum nelumboides]|nr:hypothetical protein [Adiantum nelumboides]
MISIHIRNPHQYNHHPHMDTNTSRHPAATAANHRRSDTINSMKEVAVRGAHINTIPQPLKDRCASAESSTCSRTETSINAEPNAALIKPRSHSSALASDSHPRSPKLKIKSGTSRDVINDTGRRYSDGANSCGGGCNTNHQHGASNQPICAHEAVKISAGVVDEYRAGAACRTKVLRVCCMCGDWGIAELLFVCSKCSHRHQHIYCSRSYPNMGEEASICNWCLHKEESILAKETMASDAVANKAVLATAAQIAGAENHMGALKDYKLRNHDLADEEVLVKKGHSKAFEYLLLVAEQSLPQDHNRAISGTKVEIKEEKHIKLGTTHSNRGSLAVGKVSPKDPEINKTNVIPLVNIVNVGVGPHVERKSDSSPHLNKLSMSLGTQQINIRPQSEVKISIDHTNIDVGRLIGGGIPKRQRDMNKGFNAALKCRKKGLQLSPSRPSYRRYKLLADVVC